MTNITPKTSTVFVTAPRFLTKEHLEQIVERMQGQLPIDVGVVVLDGGLTVQVVGAAPVAVEIVKDEIAGNETPSPILDELKGLRTDLACHHAEFKHMGMRVKQ